MLLKGYSKEEALGLWKKTGHIPLLQEGYEGFGLLVEKDSGLITNINKDNNTLNEAYGLRVEKNSMFVDCILQKANTENRNGRIYPKKLLEREVERYVEAINENRAGGESNHPDSTELDIKNIPHRVVKVWWDGDTLYGTLELMVSDSYLKGGNGWMPGDYIAELLKKNYKLGISSRGVGSLKTINGKNYVQDDFELICWDLVNSPSTPNAYLFTTNNKNMNESFEIKNKKNNKFNDKLSNFVKKI